MKVLSYFMKDNVMGETFQVYKKQGGFIPLIKRHPLRVLALE